jgi:uncharacterized protein (DUF302 family)
MSLNAPAPGYVVKLRSRFDFKTTIDRITESLTTRGVTIFADIDQAFAAANAGVRLRPTRVILFGNPRAGTPIMDGNPHAALELPLKIAVWQDEDGGVGVDYLNPTYLLAQGYGIENGLTSSFAAMEDALRQSIDGA